MINFLCLFVCQTPPPTPPPWQEATKRQYYFCKTMQLSQIAIFKYYSYLIPLQILYLHVLWLNRIINKLYLMMNSTLVYPQLARFSIMVMLMVIVLFTVMVLLSEHLMRFSSLGILFLLLCNFSSGRYFSSF